MGKRGIAAASKYSARISASAKLHAEQVYDRADAANGSPAWRKKDGSACVYYWAKPGKHQGWWVTPKLSATESRLAESGTSWVSLATRSTTTQGTFTGTAGSMGRGFLKCAVDKCATSRSCDFVISVDKDSRFLQS